MKNVSFSGPGMDEVCKFNNSQEQIREVRDGALGVNSKALAS